MGFKEEIAKILGGEEEGLYGKLSAEGGGTPAGAMLQSDINRKVLPGRRSKWADGMDPARLAKLDRYAWGKQAGLGGVPVVAGYEAVKALGRAPGLQGLSGALFGDVGRDFFKDDENTSPASLGNVGAYIRGALRR